MGRSFLQKGTLLAFVRKSSATQSHRDRLAGSSGGEAQTHEPRSRALRIPRLLWLHIPSSSQGVSARRAFLPAAKRRARLSLRAAKAARVWSQERAPYHPGLWTAAGGAPSVPGPRRPARGRGARLKALWAFLLRARKRPRCSLHNLELPRGASARRAFRRAERGASAWAVENRARAWPRVVCVCMCRCLCVRRVVCVSILGSLFWRPRSTQQPAASASERMRSTVGCDKNRPQKDWGLEKWPLRGLDTCVSSSASANRRRRVVFSGTFRLTFPGGWPRTAPSSGHYFSSAAL